MPGRDDRLGGYSIPQGLLSADSLLVSVGAGTDVLTPSSRWFGGHGCRALVYDPVPAAAKYMSRVVASEPSFEHLAIVKRTLQSDPFMRRLTAWCVTFGGCDLHGTPVGLARHPPRTLSTLAQANGWRRIDLLVCAEGSEFAILDTALSSGLEIRSVEWAQPVAEPVKAAISEAAFARLRAAGGAGAR